MSFQEGLRLHQLQVELTGVRSIDTCWYARCLTGVVGPAELESATSTVSRYSYQSPTGHGQ